MKTNDFIYKLNLKTDENRKIYIKLNHQLSEEDKVYLQTHSLLIIQSLAHAKIAMLTFEDLKSKITVLESSQEDKLVALPVSGLSIKEIRLPQIKRERRQLRLEMWKKAVNQWPLKIPVINVVWVLFISPFFWLRSVLKEDERVKLKSFKDFSFRQKVLTQESYLTRLEEFCDQMTPLLEDPAGKNFYDHLKKALEKGREMHKLSKNNPMELVRWSQVIGALIQEDFKKKEPLQASFPVGFHKEGKFIPLFLTFSKTDQGSLRVDVNTWGETPLEGLKKAYEFPVNDKSPSITNIVSSILMKCSDEQIPEEAPKELKIQFFEKNRLNLAKFFDSNEGASDLTFSAEKGQFDKELHGLLYLTGGKPLAVKEKDSPEKKVFFEHFIGQDLLRFYPEAPLPDKLEILLTNLYQEATFLSEAMPYLSSEEKRSALAEVEKKVRSYEQHLKKQLVQSGASTKEEVEGQIQEGKKAFQNISPLFAEFFDKIEALKLLLTNFQEDAKTSQEKEQAKIFKNVALKSFNLAVDKTFVTKKAKSSQKAEKTLSVQVKYAESLAQLTSSINSGLIATALPHLKGFDQKIDALISKRSYLEARQLALEVMKKIPVPGSARSTAFFTIEDAVDIDHLSKYCSALSTHVWECSLRMNKKTLEGPYLVQMIKMQTTILKMLRLQSTKSSSDGAHQTFYQRMNNYTVDKQEIEQLIFLHPHYRLGMYPEEEKELLEIVSYLNSDECQGKSLRLDGMLENIKCSDFFGEYGFNLKNMPRFSCINREEGAQLPLPNELIDFRRAQLMMTSLVKPDFCLTCHFKAGRFGQVSGLGWLNSMRIQAVNEGATSEDLKEKMQEIRLKLVQKELNAMKRLELTADVFVTEYPVINIVGSKKGSGGVSIMPEGYGLPPYLEKQYDLLVTEENTKEFVGKVRSTKKFLNREEGALLNSKEAIEGSTSSTLSPQKGQNEASLLFENLQKKPVEGIDQLTQYELDGLEYATVDIAGEEIAKIDPRSIFNAMNLVQKNPEILKKSDVRRRIELIIHRPFALQLALRANPLFFKEYALQLKKDMVTHVGDERISTYFIQLSDLLNSHIQTALEDLETAEDPYKHLSSPYELDALKTKLLEMKDAFPKIEGKSYSHLIQLFQNPDSDRAALSCLLLKHLSRQEINFTTEEELATILIAADVFLKSSIEVSMPQFNEQIKRFIVNQLIPYALQEKIQELQRDKVLDKMVQIYSGDAFYQGVWSAKGNSFQSSAYAIN